MIDRSVVHSSADDSDESSDEDRLPTTRRRVIVLVSSSTESRAAGKLPCTATLKLFVLTLNFISVTQIISRFGLESSASTYPESGRSRSSVPSS